MLGFTLKETSHETERAVKTTPLSTRGVRIATGTLPPPGGNGMNLISSDEWSGLAERLAVEVLSCIHV